MGVFFAVDRNLLSNPKTFSLEPVVLACKKLLQFEQVFLRENFCENVAEIAKCSNYGFEIIDDHHIFFECLVFRV